MFLYLQVVSYLISLDAYPGELEETAGDLELCRRKLATLRSQKEAAAAVAPPTPGTAQLGVKIEGGDRGSGNDKVSREACELEAALEETKVQLMILLASRNPFAFQTWLIRILKKSVWSSICILASFSCMHDRSRKYLIVARNILSHISALSFMVLA